MQIIIELHVAVCLALKEIHYKNVNRLNVTQTLNVPAIVHAFKTIALIHAQITIINCVPKMLYAMSEIMLQIVDVLKIYLTVIRCRSANADQQHMMKVYQNVKWTTIVPVSWHA